MADSDVRDLCRNVRAGHASVERLIAAERRSGLRCRCGALVAYPHTHSAACKETPWAAQ